MATILVIQLVGAWWLAVMVMVMVMLVVVVVAVVVVVFGRGGEGVDGCPGWPLHSNGARPASRAALEGLIAAMGLAWLPHLNFSTQNPPLTWSPIDPLMASA